MISEYFFVKVEVIESSQMKEIANIKALYGNEVRDLKVFIIISVISRKLNIIISLLLLLFFYYYYHYYHYYQ